MIFSTMEKANRKHAVAKHNLSEGLQVGCPTWNWETEFWNHKDAPSKVKTNHRRRGSRMVNRKDEQVWKSVCK